MNTYIVRNKNGETVMTAKFPVSLKAEFEALGFTVEKTTPLATVEAIQSLAQTLEEAHR